MRIILILAGELFRFYDRPRQDNVGGQKTDKIPKQENHSENLKSFKPDRFRFSSKEERPRKIYKKPFSKFINQRGCYVGK